MSKKARLLQGPVRLGGTRDVNDPEVIRRFGMLKELTPLRCFFRGDATVKAGDLYAPNGLLNEYSPAVKIKKGDACIGQKIIWNRMWYRRRHVKKPKPNKQVGNSAQNEQS